MSYDKVGEHYIPVMILKRHASRLLTDTRYSYIWCYENGTNEEKRLKDVCNVDYFYESPYLSKNRIENRLSKLETKASDVLDRVANGKFKNILPAKERKIIDEFAVTQFLRVPFIIYENGCLLKDLLKGKLSNEIQLMLKKDCFNFAKVLSLNKTGCKSDFVLYEIWINEFSKYNIYCFETTDTLILSDLCPIFPLGFLNEYVTFVFPFDKKHYLMWTKGEFDKFYNEADIHKTRITNKLTSMFGNVFYSSISYTEIQKDEVLFKNVNTKIAVQA